jgi:hypothetical protein
MISKKTFIKSEANSYSRRQSTKKPVTGDKIKPLSFQKVGLKNRQLRVTWLVYFIMPFRMGKCHSQHVLLHPKE